MSLMTSPSSPLRLALCVTLGLLLGAGCYNPTFTDGQFRCASDSECPDGQVCRPLGDGLRCLWPSSDLGASDSACAGKGMALATGVWACTGDFVAGQGASLCRGAYEPCAQKHAAALGRVPAETCSALTGFYAIDFTIEKVNDSNGGFSVDCSRGMSIDMPYGLLGCGAAPGVAAVTSAPGCPPPPRALRCDRNDDWDCRDGFASASLKNSAASGGGVLCCAR